MDSAKYRDIIRKISGKHFRKRFPGLKQTKEIDEAARKIAVEIHATLYGANVDGVDSPLWPTPTN